MSGLPAVTLGDSLRERFNEDYFRNPSTGTWFQEHAERAGVDSTRPAAADLAKVSQRLLRLMGT